MTQRLEIRLPDPTMARLRHQADAAGETPAAHAAQLVRGILSGPGAHRREPKAAMPLAQPAPWLEPTDGDAGWWADMWQAITVLYHRYPKALEYLKDGWWEEPSQLETLAALAVWRERLDSQATDPREELDFQTQLNHYHEQLRRQGGSVTHQWKPGLEPTGQERRRAVE